MLVFTALALGTLLLLASLVIDLGNWWVHKKHVQTRADAAALAGAALINPLSCSDSAIAAEANDYAGGAYNQNIGGRTPITTLDLNQGPADIPLTGSPCADKAVDVHVTEPNAGGLFYTLLSKNVSAHARVEVRGAGSVKGMMPLAMRDPVPKAVRAVFVDEITGAEVDSVDLVKAGSSSGLVTFDNAAAPKTVTVSSSRVGVKIIFSDSGSFTCGTTGVTCFDGGSAGVGLTSVRGWSNTPTVLADEPPQARSAYLLPGDCGDAYYNAGGCTLGLRMKIDLQPGLAAEDFEAVATIDGDDYDLAYDATNNLWWSDALPVPTDAGALPITVAWTQRAGKIGDAQCTDKDNGKDANPAACADQPFGQVQRTYSYGPNHGDPIARLWVGAGGTPYGVNDVERGTATGFTVSIGIAGAIGLSSATDPPTVFSVGTPQGSQRLDCDPAIARLEDEIAQGCNASYKLNTGQTCPDSNTGVAQPWPCVAVATGNQVGHVGTGLNLRVFGDEKPKICTAEDNWPNFTDDDPRLVPVFIAPSSSFTGSGNYTVPVLNFAWVYLTDWGGQGLSDNPCPRDPDDPVPASNQIVGHYVKHIDTTGNTTPSEESCDFTTIRGCASVMTR